jgi:membrane-bound metal-dependent hydrolase YbcI (DUF457 family)
MPTPIGHSLAGAVIYALSTRRRNLLASWRWLVVCMIVAALPDIDFVPALFGRFDIANRVHRHVTHTALMAVVVGIVAYGVLRGLRRARPVRYAAIIFSCWASHIFLDLLGKDYRPPIGIRFLWPFVGKSYKIPLEVFLDVHKDTYADVFTAHNAVVLLQEVLIFGAMLSVIVVVKLLYGLKQRRGKEDEGFSADGTK